MIKKGISITAEGKKDLEKELEELIANRPVITERIATARAFGDLSENEEYRAARAEQKFAESRILEIEDILKNAAIIQAGKKSTSKSRAYQKWKLMLNRSYAKISAFGNEVQFRLPPV